MTKGDIVLLVVIIGAGAVALLAWESYQASKNSFASQLGSSLPVILAAL